MRRVDKTLLAVAVVVLVGAVIVLEATPGSVLSQRTADGAPAHREYVVAFVGLIVLALAALGMDVRDWF